MAPRALLIGLDCAPPSLVFERWADHLPHLSALRARGRWGPLRSCMPPITVPAWTCMVSGRDPGELGLYGFRNRPRDRGYDLRVASAKDVKVKRVWDRLGEAGHTAAALFVPLSWPPTPLRGWMVSGFLTPDAAKPWAFPRALKAELEARFGPYRVDVADFRGGDLARVFDELHAMTAQHFAMARHVWTEKRPGFLMMVEMGPDRLHHAAWQHLDPAAPGYVPGNPWEARARGYYAALDAEIGRLLAETDEETLVLVASDHGARAMEGAVAVNEVLRRAGWLVLREEPREPTRLREVIDWGRTKAWGEGGYYARIFLNVAGREPAGALPASEAEAARDAIAALLEEAGPAGTRVWRPEALYGTVRGQPPDLLAVFADLAWRAEGSVGHASALL
ncbi:MAG TPA: alkaline phosphatase family protein, partial [Polyangiaceae bacterium LLY-WYZ-15_(1-7)]|nr:alkaline phosphatase family protein [Polyangiaceae bacterium LLY-WYZ-15_(1-7)]